MASESNSSSQVCANGAQILPTRERQVRPLTGLNSEQQREIWQQAVEEAGGKVPSGRRVKDIVQRIRERTPVPNPFQVGEVCKIVAKDNPELRGKGGYWCIVSQVHEWSCTVTTWDAEYLVGLEHLESFGYSQKECQQMEDLGVRMTRLYETGALHRVAISFLKDLGKLDKPYLDPFEEKLLQFVEQEYGINS